MRPLEGHTTKKMKTILLLAFALLTFLTPFAHASPPRTATGTFTASFTVLSVAAAGGNTIITVNETATLAGSFVGTRIAQGLRDNSSGRLIHRKRHRNVYWNIRRRTGIPGRYGS